MRIGEESNQTSKGHEDAMQAIRANMDDAARHYQHDAQFLPRRSRERCNEGVAAAKQKALGMIEGARRIDVPIETKTRIAYEGLQAIERI
jgi:hypothetical protein